MHTVIPKTVFIAHPVNGDVKSNVKKVLKICKEAHSASIIPVAPYLGTLQYLDDADAESRQLGIQANMECFHRKYIDELWLYGDYISPGMWQEIQRAMTLGIPIVPQSDGTKRDLAASYQVE